MIDDDGGNCKKFINTCRRFSLQFALLHYKYTRITIQFLPVYAIDERM